MNGHRARVARVNRFLPSDRLALDAAFTTLEAELAKVDRASITDDDRTELAAFLASLDRQHPTPYSTGRRPGVR